MAQAQWIDFTHPTYDALEDTWELLQQSFRGDGGYLDGSLLVAHPREILYKRNVDLSVSDEQAGYRAKYTRRQNLARYENFARAIIDTLLAHLFAKAIGRDAEAVPDLAAWWENVDGAGTHIADWMRLEEALALVYGHVFVLMDTQPGPVEPARTRAEQGRPVLRLYSPLDAPDWIWANGELQAIKLVEAVPRGDLTEKSDADDPVEVGTDAGAADYEYVVWTKDEWTRYDDEGNRLDGGPHGFGRVPVLAHRAREIPGQALIGGSALGDPRLYKDHFNLVSELRELLRGQTFSMLNIQLGPDEQVTDARSRLGEAASTETIVFSRGAAGFIAPPDGPAVIYQAEIEKLERAMYRMAGLPWEGDSRAAESADSRRLKTQDLNRLLAMYADEAERVEYQIARLWVTATTGQQEQARITEALKDVTIHYPDEFATIDTAQAAADVRDVATMSLGPTANAEARKRAVPIVLPDLDEALQQTVNDEIDAQAKQAEVLKTQAAAAFRAKVTAVAPIKPDEGLGVAPGAQPSVAPQMVAGA